MKPFAYHRACSVEETVGMLSPAAPPVAGGTNLLDLMKLQLMHAPQLLDINRLDLGAIEAADDGGLVLGATARNADTAYHPQVRRDYPLLSAAILAGASPQIRNMASNAGNLLQRTRCTYFYDGATPCNKRTPGAGCSAIGGLTKYHAILGASEHCIATHPSDMCVALAALDAEVHVRGAAGARMIPFGEFHRLPGDRPDVDSTLRPDELITHLRLPPAERFAAHSAYLKIRERLSYAFALVSVAVALDLDDAGLVREARVAVGGVAHKPWRRVEAEQRLQGASPTDATACDAAVDVLLDGAVHQGQNAFKPALVRRAVRRALAAAAAGTVDNHGDRDGDGGTPREQAS